MKLLTFYSEWQNYAGFKVKINGVAHVLKVTTSPSRFYDAWTISVFGDPVDKTTPEYRAIRAQLRDDWSTDVLELDCEELVKVEQQCKERRRPTSPIIT